MFFLIVLQVPVLPQVHIIIFSQFVLKILCKFPLRFRSFHWHGLSLFKNSLRVQLTKQLQKVGLHLVVIYNVYSANMASRTRGVTSGADQDITSEYCWYSAGDEVDLQLSCFASCRVMLYCNCWVILAVVIGAFMFPEIIEMRRSQLNVGFRLGRWDIRSIKIFILHMKTTSFSLRDKNCKSTTLV